MRKNSTYGRVADIIDFDELLAELDRDAANTSTQNSIFEDEDVGVDISLLLRAA